MIGGFPASDGGAYADFFEPVDGLVAFPGWEPFEGADSDDLDQEARDKLTADMVPVLEGVSRGIVKLNDDRRFAVPLNLVCPEFSPDDAKEWIASGGIPELTKVTNLVFTDIDSGHWPMVTQPAVLASLLVSP